MEERTPFRFGCSPSKTQQLRWFHSDQATKIIVELNPSLTGPSTLLFTLSHQSSKELYFLPRFEQLINPKSIWKSWAPGKCKFFMWLVAHDKCWMADRLARKGLPHPEHCLLCDQEAICYCIAFSHGRSGSVFYKGSVSGFSTTIC